MEITHDFTIYPVKDITIKKCIYKCSTSSIYKGVLDGKNIIIKYCDKDISEQTIHAELDIYARFKGAKRLITLYGISYIESSIYLLMKHYNHNGDLYSYINNDCFWKYYGRNCHKNTAYIHSINDMYYEYSKTRNSKINILYQMCLALQELHSYNIVHCDIKLNNMLYHTESKDNKYIILFDFDGSKYLGNNKIIQVDTFIGTTGYTSPEMEDCIISKKGDIYSLGVSMLEVWIGKIWSNGETYKECRKEVLSSLKSVKTIDYELYQLLLTCLHTELHKRPYIETLLHKFRMIFSDNIIDTTHS